MTGFSEVIDCDGYRANVGIVLCNQQSQVMWARRVGGRNAWQFPQGGVAEGEDTDAAMYRELWEETGLRQNDVEVLAEQSAYDGFFKLKISRIS